MILECRPATFSAPQRSVDIRGAVALRDVAGVGAAVVRGAVGVGAAVVRSAR